MNFWPIYQTSTYAQKSPGDHKGFEYSRTHNPTRTALESSLASIENGKFGLAFGSGLAAIDAVLKLLKPGDEIISTNDLYGGSYRLFTKIFEDYGLVFHFTEMQNLSSVENLINNKTKLIWVETPTNPMMNIIDINRLSLIARKFNILLGVDNTFATPFLQQPLSLGADIVMHSATKYLAGPSMKAVVTTNLASLLHTMYATFHDTFVSWQHPLGVSSEGKHSSSMGHALLRSSVSRCVIIKRPVAQ